MKINQSAFALIVECGAPKADKLAPIYELAQRSLVNRDAASAFFKGADGKALKDRKAIAYSPEAGDRLAAEVVKALGEYFDSVSCTHSKRAEAEPISDEAAVQLLVKRGMLTAEQAKAMLDAAAAAKVAAEVPEGERAAD
jgi:hypothetical protein